jgi:glutathione S-transferase
VEIEFSHLLAFEDVLYYYRSAFSEDSYKEEYRKLIDETIPSTLERFDGIVAKNGGYFVNGTLSYADIYFVSILEYIYGFFEYMEIKFERDLLEKFENLRKLNEKVRNIESIKKWIAARPVTKG